MTKITLVMCKISHTQALKLRDMLKFAVNFTAISWNVVKIFFYPLARHNNDTRTKSRR